MRSSLPPVCTVAEIRELERAAQAEAPGIDLMARAGLAAAALARELVGEQGTDILVLAGPGNNGGDALEAAVHLRSWFFRVSVIFTGSPTALPQDAANALDKWRKAGGELLAEIPLQRRYGLIIDGLYGIGLSRPVAGRDALLIEAANAIDAPVLALDIPSGVAGDTGAALGPAIRAAHTITFITLKPGLVTADGPDFAGRLHIADLGLEVERLLHAQGRLLDSPGSDDWPAPRPRNFHKGLAGSVAIVGGAPGMAGAALLAARAALRIGTGKVFLGMLDADAPAVDPMQPELMIRKADLVLAGGHIDAIGIGPGMGTDTVSQRILSQALRADAPVVIDADALNLIAQYHLLKSALATRSAPAVLTPHPAEAARLLSIPTATVQGDRLHAAREIARRCNAICVLKGNGSVIATPDGRFWINATGNPGMASAGMGDVLTGLVAGFCAQGLDPAAAARLGVWLHGAAGDACVAQGRGPAGLTASDVIDAARQLLNAPR